MTHEFRTDLGRNVFLARYALTQAETWRQRSKTVVDDVAGTRGGKTTPILSDSERELLVDAISSFKFIPGGRYLYYGGRGASFFNNCYLFKSGDDTREAWASLCQDAASALMSGGGIGNDYSVFRPRGSLLGRTGGQASGPVPLMYMINEIGRNVMQGGSRRSAIYASLNWQHEDIAEFMAAKDWDNIPIIGTGMSYGDLKKQDFNFAAPLDMTNVSVNYDDEWLMDSSNRHEHEIFQKNIEYAMRNGEPGFSFNFGPKVNETARNACTEVTSEDDGDVCNLGSINLGAIDSISELVDIVAVASKFLVCGTVRGELPSEKIKAVREKNRRLGLGLMGIHEWLLKRGYKYEVTPELHQWLKVYRDVSEHAANEHCDRLYLSPPVAYRAIAPTGTIGTLAGTTTGIEPLYAVAFKRRYIVDGTRYKYEYVVDHTAQTLIDELGVDPDSIETATTLASDPARRIKFQADVQDYVDMAISSTLNLPAWGSKENNEDKVKDMAKVVSEYAPRLRGLTFYPDGARGGQPITSIAYEDALKHKGVVYEENETCAGGVCGL